jgi:hypothetical protein
MRLFKKFHHLGSLALWVIFLFVTIVVFGQSLNNFFASDDWHWLAIARDTSLSAQIFITNYTGDHLGGSYNPLLVLIFKLFYNIFSAIGGSAPGGHYFGYHLISLALHATNAFLVYSLAKNIFNLPAGKAGVIDFANTKKLAILTASIFLLYPIHVEIVSWIAAWPHLWVTLFYLLALINYFAFRESNNIKKLFYSLSFFILALLTKEIAISLPLVILIWEIYFYSQIPPSLGKLGTPPFVKGGLFRQVPLVKGGFRGIYLPGYFIILALFLWLRYISIGLVFGYYAQSSLGFTWLDWIANLAAFGGDLLTFGFLRTIIYKGIYHYLDSVAIIVMVSLALYFLVILIKKKYLQFASCLSVLFILGPVLVTGLHRTSFGGERYLYLASIFFIIWLIILLKNIKVNFKINRYVPQGTLSRFAIHLVLILIFILFLTINAHKLSIWDSASNLSQQIVMSYQELDTKPNQKLLSVALPDNLEGAEVFRNNLQQALEFYYPDNHPEIVTTFAYSEVTKQNKNNQLLKWRQDERGWLAESIDGSFVVTGITSITKNNVYWELWNYNYQNYKANTIRLLPQPDVLEQIKKDEIKILIFDRGVLQILE